MSQDPRFGQSPAQARAPFIPQLNLSSVPTQTSRPGGFWIRFAATVIDGLIIGVVCLPLKLVFEIGAGVAGDGALKLVIAGLGMVLQYVIMFFYYGWFYSNKGASPGKLLMGLKVLDSETGAHLSYWRAFFRETIGKIISGITLCIGFIMAGVRDDKKALHDMMFNTQVIRTK
jgi:uncharacterized RDD family membrane protein YckC